jgi:hypothetical protein
VQFEGYLLTKPELKYKYDSPQHMKIGGMDFYVDTPTRMVKKLKRGEIA